MTLEELEKEKLRQEIKALSTPGWKKPAFIISALTVIITAWLGFREYFERVDQENLTKIENLETKITAHKKLKDELKDEKFNLHVERQNQEKANLQSEIQLERQESESIKSRNAEVSKELSKAENRLRNIENKLNNLINNSAIDKDRINTIIASPSGQKTIKAILSEEVEDKRRYRIGEFAFGVSNQVATESLKKILLEIEALIK